MCILRTSENLYCYRRLWLVGDFVNEESLNISLLSVVEFLKNAASENFGSDIEEMFHVGHPRFKSFSQMRGKILDIGSGDGGMGQLINWPISQTDKSLVGCDIKDRSTLPPGYSEWISGGWEMISSEQKYGGILAIHLIEHLESWAQMLECAINALEPGKFIYVEWPVEESTAWPTASEIWRIFQKSNPNFPEQLLTTFNFYDDNTHTSHPPKISDVISASLGIEIVESGRILMPHVGRSLVAKGFRDQSISNVTMGTWAHFGFAQFIFGRKTK